MTHPLEGRRSNYIALRCGDATANEQTLAADEIEWRRSALARLEQIYNTDRIAQDLAGEIEAIFDQQGPTRPYRSGRPWITEKPTDAKQIPRTLLTRAT